MFCSSHQAEFTKTAGMVVSSAFPQYSPAAPLRESAWSQMKTWSWIHNSSIQSDIYFWWFCIFNIWIHSKLHMTIPWSGIKIHESIRLEAPPPSPHHLHQVSWKPMKSLFWNPAEKPTIQQTNGHFLESGFIRWWSPQEPTARPPFSWPSWVWLPPPSVNSL